MAKAYPKEFRDDVVAVARKGEAPLNQAGMTHLEGTHDCHS